MIGKGKDRKEPALRVVLVAAVKNGFEFVIGSSQIERHLIIKPELGRVVDVEGFEIELNTGHSRVGADGTGKDVCIGACLTFTQSFKLLQIAPRIKAPIEGRNHDDIAAGFRIGLGAHKAARSGLLKASARVLRARWVIVNVHLIRRAVGAAEAFHLEVAPIGENLIDPVSGLGLPVVLRDHFSPEARAHIGLSIGPVRKSGVIHPSPIAPGRKPASRRRAGLVRAIAWVRRIGFSRRGRIRLNRGRRWHLRQFGELFTGAIGPDAQTHPVHGELQGAISIKKS